MFAKEIVENGHMDLFTKEYVVGHVLDDFSDDHAPPTVSFVGQLNVDSLG